MEIKPVKSAREDKRGHWPKGKRRNDPSPEWPQVLKQLQRLLRTPSRNRGEKGLQRSRRGLANYLGASERQVRRWLAKEHMPTTDRVGKIKKFIQRLPLFTT